MREYIIGRIKTKNNAVMEALKGQFNNWFTISSLSMKLFNNYFLDYNL